MRVGQRVGQTGRERVRVWVRQAESGSESGSHRQRVGKRVGHTGRELVREWVRRAESWSKMG